MTSLYERMTAIGDRAEALVRMRESFCASCPHVERREDGTLHCPKCGCSAPQGKARCPEGLWGEEGAPGCSVPYGAECPRFALKATEAICFQCKHPDPVKRALWVQQARVKRLAAETAKDIKNSSGYLKDLLAEWRKAHGLGGLAAESGVD